MVEKEPAQTPDSPKASEGKEKQGKKTDDMDELRRELAEQRKTKIKFF